MWAQRMWEASPVASPRRMRANPPTTISTAETSKTLRARGARWAYRDPMLQRMAAPRSPTAEIKERWPPELGSTRTATPPKPSNTPSQPKGPGLPEPLRESPSRAHPQRDGGNHQGGQPGLDLDLTQREQTVSTQQEEETHHRRTERLPAARGAP